MEVFDIDSVCFTTQRVTPQESLLNHAVTPLSAIIASYMFTERFRVTTVTVLAACILSEGENFNGKY